MGINREAPKAQAAPAPQKALTAEQAAPKEPPAPQAEIVEVKTTVEEMPIPIKPEINTVTKGDQAVAVITTTEEMAPAAPGPQNIVPDVSSPF